jgi:hypothetical protein
VSFVTSQQLKVTIPSSHCSSIWRASDLKLHTSAGDPLNFRPNRVLFAVLNLLLSPGSQATWIASLRACCLGKCCSAKKELAIDLARGASPVGKSRSRLPGGTLKRAEALRPWATVLLTSCPVLKDKMRGAGACDAA